MQSLLILGRQPALGLAELESLYGPDKVHPLLPAAAVLDVDPCILAYDRLGGSIKFCKVLTELAVCDWAEIERVLVKVSPKHSQSMPAGKLLLGISGYGFSVSAKQIMSTAIKLKQAIRTTGRSVRVIPNKDASLSSAQVIHNKLTSPNGWELIIVKAGQHSIIAQTVKVQDIAGYARRDQVRPERDTRIGMLPPKLAQIIINLAVGKLTAEAAQSICNTPPDQPIAKNHFDNTIILDPFCGTGVVLQEALIMGYDCIGSDISPRMVEATRNNIDWLCKLKPPLLHSRAKAIVMAGDAGRTNWPKPVSFVATETYLGKPLSVIPSAKMMQSIIDECDHLIRQFLINIASQLTAGSRLCLAVPCWIAGENFIHLPLLDSLEVIGYNRVSFRHALNTELIYYRNQQIVARELLVINVR